MMVIIGTLPSRFSDKINNFTNAPSYEHAYKNYLDFCPRYIGRLVTFKIMRCLKGCIGLHSNNLTKTRTKWQ